jgi:hypothetical protein
MTRRKRPESVCANCGVPLKGLAWQAVPRPRGSRDRWGWNTHVAMCPPCLPLFGREGQRLGDCEVIVQALEPEVPMLGEEKK